MIQLLRVPVVPVEDPGSVLSTHVVVYSHPQTQFQGIQCHTLASVSTRQEHSVRARGLPHPSYLDSLWPCYFRYITLLLSFCLHSVFISHTHTRFCGSCCLDDLFCSRWHPLWHEASLSSYRTHVTDIGMANAVFNTLLKGGSKRLKEWDQLLF